MVTTHEKNRTPLSSHVPHTNPLVDGPSYAARTASILIKMSNGLRFSNTSRALVGAVLIAPVMDKHSNLWTLSSCNRVVVFSTLGHQTIAPYVKMGLTTAQLSHLRTFGFRPHNTRHPFKLRNGHVTI